VAGSGVPGLFAEAVNELMCPAHSNSVSGIRQKTWHSFTARGSSPAGVAGSAFLRARTDDEDSHAEIGAFLR
jgi:hypothetical protein